jgi:hypothetical protein
MKFNYPSISIPQLIHFSHINWGMEMDGWLNFMNNNNIFLIYIVKGPKLFVKAKQRHSCFIFTP